jgi:hypothetical protein
MIKFLKQAWKIEKDRDTFKIFEYKYSMLNIQCSIFNVQYSMFKSQFKLVYDFLCHSERSEAI